MFMSSCRAYVMQVFLAGKYYPRPLEVDFPQNWSPRIQAFGGNQILELCAEQVLRNYPEWAGLGPKLLIYVAVCCMWRGRSIYLVGLREAFSR